jgi:hypothetical protein
VITGEALIMPSKVRVAYEEHTPQPAGAFALWALGPWAWAAQGTAILGMLGLSALSVLTGAVIADRS